MKDPFSSPSPGAKTSEASLATGRDELADLREAARTLPLSEKVTVLRMLRRLLGGRGDVQETLGLSEADLVSPVPSSDGNVRQPDPTEGSGKGRTGG